MWIKKSKSKNICAPKLRNLPPTSAAFGMHLLRSHYQCILWKSVLHANPPDIDPCMFGWEKDPSSKSLIPTMLPPFTNVAPNEVLQTMACNCKSSEPCGKGNCSCKRKKFHAQFSVGAQQVAATHTQTSKLKT